MITNAKVRFAISNALDYKLVELVMVIMIVQMGFTAIQMRLGHILVPVKYTGKRERLAIMITNVQTTCSAGLRLQQNQLQILNLV